MERSKAETMNVAFVAEKTESSEDELIGTAVASGKVDRRTTLVLGEAENVKSVEEVRRRGGHKSKEGRKKRRREGVKGKTIRKSVYQMALRTPGRRPA